MLITQVRRARRVSPPIWAGWQTGRRDLGRSRAAVAALEFGLIAPVMAILTIGVFDLSKALVLWKDTWAAARSIAESASSLAIQGNGSSNLTQTQAQQALSMVFAEMPWLRAGIATGNPGAGVIAPNTVSAVLTSVSFQPNSSTCTANCSYSAVVQWSKAYSGNNFMTNSTVLRPCATLTQTNAGTVQTLSTMPTQQVAAVLQTSNATASDATLIADVTFVYTPFFFKFITGPITFWATSYPPPRSNFILNSTSSSTVTTIPPAWTTYTPSTSGDTAAVQCTYSSS